GHRASVDPADAHDSVRDESVVEAVVRSPVGDDARGIADDVSRHPDPAGLGVLTVDTGVADMRGGLEHDLARVRRVRQRLLVAGHPRGEDDPAEGDAARTVGAYDVPGAVLEDEDRPVCRAEVAGEVGHASPSAAGAADSGAAEEGGTA